ncbi:MAG: DNA-binding response regulator, partial [Aquincola tertiaricarbonis]
MSAREAMNLTRIVLVVDDAPQSLGPLVAALEDDGYTVLVARDGTSALERLALVV